MHSKTLVIVEDSYQIDKLLDLARARQKVGVSLVLVALTQKVSEALSSRGLEFKTIENYGISNEYLEEEGLKWFRSFPNIKTKDNKNIKELITHDGISMWWLVDELLYQSHYAFHQLRGMIKQVILLDQITSK